MAYMFPIPAGTQPRQCRDCGQTIWWILTRNGKRIPISIHAPGAKASTLEEPGQGIAHFADCPVSNTRRLQKANAGKTPERLAPAKARARSTAAAWPKLSEQLIGLFPATPLACQQCNTAPTDPSTLERWFEHDDHDRVTDTVIVLCHKCSAQTIWKHPRLYSRVGRYRPVPGTNTMCGDCRHRDGLHCAEVFKIGVHGLGLQFLVPDVAMVRMTGGCQQLVIYKGEPSCERRDVRALEPTA